MCHALLQAKAEPELSFASFSVRSDYDAEHELFYPELSDMVTW